MCLPASTPAQLYMLCFCLALSYFSAFHISKVCMFYEYVLNPKLHILCFAGIKLFWCLSYSQNVYVYCFMLINMLFYTDDKYVIYQW